MSASPDRAQLASGPPGGAETVGDRRPAPDVPDVEEARLVDAARQAWERAYAPYSRFQVGAAVLASGQVFAGCNVENASYGLTVCAERAAVFAAISAGARDITAVAIVTDSTAPTPPCGACRQVLREFGRDVTVLSATLSGRLSRHTLSDLLPSSFGPDNL